MNRTIAILALGLAPALVACKGNKSKPAPSTGTGSGSGSAVAANPAVDKARAFIADEILPLEDNPASYDEHENIREDVLQTARAKAKAAGLWAPQAPKDRGGLGLPVVGWAAVYEEANRSIFGPAAMNCAAVRSVRSRSSAGSCSTVIACMFAMK